MTDRTLRSERYKFTELYINVYANAVILSSYLLIRSEFLTLKIQIPQLSCNSYSLKIDVFVLKSMVAFVW